MSRDVSLLQNTQTSSETHSASSSVGTGDKTAGACDIDHSHPAGAQIEWHFVSAPLICLYGVDRNTFILLCGFKIWTYMGSVGITSSTYARLRSDVWLL